MACGPGVCLRTDREPSDCRNRGRAAAGYRKLGGSADRLTIKLEMSEGTARTVDLGTGLPPVCRLGLATRGGSRIRPEDVHWAVEQGVNYLNWCGKPDGLSRAVAELGRERRRVVVAVQFHARTADEAEREWERLCRELGTELLDVLTFYYVESEDEWRQITGPGGAYEFLAEQKRTGRLRMIGLTSHQRKLAAAWAGSGLLDMLMVRYNAAHRGAEQDVFPVTRRLGMPVAVFTCLRWKALLAPTPDDPPGTRPPAAVDCYRFCLSHPDVAVALAAVNSRTELAHALGLLRDWRACSAEEMAAIRAHGDRVHRHAGLFW